MDFLTIYYLHQYFFLLDIYQQLLLYKLSNKGKFKAEKKKLYWNLYLEMKSPRDIDD